MTADEYPAYSFDDIVVEPRTCEVFKRGAAVALEPKAFNLLIFLIENRGRLVEKDEILDVVWKEASVTENSLASAIAKLRRMLGDDSKTAKYIQTIHTRGYRFIAEVEVKRSSGTNGSPRAEAAAGRNKDARSAAAATVPRTVAAGEAVGKLLLQPRSLIALLILGGFAAAVLVGAIFLRKPTGASRQQAANPPIASLAILPFQSAGAGTTGKDDGYLGFEIADALTTKLSEATQLAVRPATSVLHYSESKLEPADAGRALNVDYVLEGRIQRSPDVVTVRLIRIRDGAALLTETFEEKFTNIFQLEETLSAKILRALTVTLDHEEKQRFRKRYTENAEAYEAFLRAHYFMNQATREGVDKGIETFQRAIELDPNYAMAYAGLGDCYLRLLRFGVPRTEFLPKSREAVTKALELDDTVAYAHSMLGYIAYQYDWDFARAQREYELGKKYEPSLRHQWHASYLLALNRIPEATREYREFADFLPYQLPGNASFGQFFYLTKQYDQAVDQLQKTLKMQAKYPPALEYLGMVYEQEGRSQEAVAKLQEAIDASDGRYGVGSLGHLYASVGKNVEARKLLQSLEEHAKHEYVSPYQRALIEAGLDEKEKALDDLEKAYAERSLYAPYLQFDPRLSNLRGEPRFKDFARRVGLVL
jgi:DNA-binding winged helix-turn-helix (wHTH) protein/TolB-like protein